jgi:hypothetical protein
MDTEELQKIIFNGFLKIKEMEGVPLYTKHRMLQNLMGMNKDGWIVIGITEAALDKFKENGCKRTKGVNRSHIFQRSATSQKMLEKTDWDIESWWSFYVERDECILATSSENMNKEPDVIKHEVPRGLFKTLAIGFTVKNAETEFLKNLSN